MKERGVTLIELVITITVIAIAVSAVLGTLAATSKSSSEGMARTQAMAIAEAYLEEIRLKPCVDPDGTDGETGRINYDDVDDYNGVNDIGAVDQFGNAISGLSKYQVAVAVVHSSALTGVPSANAFRIDITVTYPAAGVDVRLSGYRGELLMRARGFTIIELIVAITLTAIVVAFTTYLISGPIRAYMDQSRRSELVAAADNALLNVARDVRRAVPNSTRVATTATTAALEMLSSIDAVRYRASGALGTPALELDFTTPDGSFSTLGKFTHVAHPYSSTARYLSVYNIGITGADAYELANVMTPAGTTITISDGSTTGEDVVTMSPSFKFAYGSPAKRVYLVEGPITYLCDLTEGTLRRFSGYAIASSQAQRDTTSELVSAGATNALLARNVTACVFTYATGTAQRAGLVTATLTVSKNGELVRLLQQVHVENAP